MDSIYCDIRLVNGVMAKQAKMFFFDAVTCSSLSEKKPQFSFDISETSERF